MMTATIREVAKEAHVSVSTVSRSFTRPDMVSDATRAKVLRIADELDFSISRSAAALKSGRTLRIALLISDHLRLWFSASIIEGLNQVFHDKGYDLSIFQISSIDERREFFDMLPVRRNADAVLVASFDVAPDEIERLSRTDVPIVGINCVDARNTGFNAAVNIDDEQGSQLAARHLIGLGHRHIVYVRTDRAVSLHFSVQNRYESFLDCCGASGITPTTIVAPEGDDRISSVITDLLSMPTPPTAIACQEDGIAIPLIFQLKRNGFDVPGNISVIGYDDSFYAQDVGLTTIRQEPLRMARLVALKTLDLMLRGISDTPFETVPARLIVRSTTAEAHCADA